MLKQHSSERLKSSLTPIPGATPRERLLQAASRPARLISLLAVLLFALFFVRWLTGPPVRDVAQSTPPPKIDVPAPAADPNAALPHATEQQPGVASVEEMTQPWASKNFFYRNRSTGENVPATVVRLPIASPNQSASYWAFSLNPPSGNCRLEYITDLRKLRTVYGFHDAKYPMVGNPCSHTVYDPLKLMNIPGSVWVRGAIVQGSDLRPPLAIEVEVRGKQILAARMEQQLPARP